MDRAWIMILHMKKICSFALATLTLFALSSCNTFIGMGRDIESLGEGMQNKADGKTWSGREKNAPEAVPYSAY